MKSSKCYLLLRGNKLYMSSDKFNLKEMSFKYIKNYPNVPFHINLWDNRKNLEQLKDFFTAEAYENSSLLDKLAWKELYVLVPDDSQPVEQKALQEYLFLATGKVKKIKLMFSFECHHISSSLQSYVCISKTERMLVLTYIRGDSIVIQAFLQDKDYEVEELRSNIKDLHMDCRNNNVQVFLNGEELQKYSSLGAMVTYNELLENFKLVSEPFIEFSQFY